MAWLWWLAAALALVVVQMIVVDVLFLMLAAGALAAALAAGLGAPFWAQALAFAVVSVVLVAIVRPIAMQRLKGGEDGTSTNARALVGRTAEVVVDVTTRSGRVKLAGEVWTARTEDSAHVLTTGTVVRVVRIDGATAVVTAITAPLP